MNTNIQEKRSMTPPTSDLSRRQSALLLGIVFLFILPLGVFAKVVAPAILIVPEDPAATIGNLMASAGLFRTSIVAALLTYALDIVIALGLYTLLRPVNKSFALLGAWFRVVYSTIAAIAMLNHLLAWQLISGTSSSTALTTAQLQMFVDLFLNGHDYGWLIGFLFFGLHLCIVGALAFQASYMPRTLGFFLLWGGVGWLIHSLGHLLDPNYANYVVVSQGIAYSAAIGEFYLMGWGLWTGLKGQPSETPTLEPASVNL